MPSNYRNYYGDEASKPLMISFGLEPQSQKALPRLPLTVSGFMEQDRQKDQEMYELKEQMKKMGQKTDVVERQLDSMEYWIVKLIQNLVQPSGAYPAAVTEAIQEANRKEEPIRVREGRGTIKEINEWLASPNLTSTERHKLEVLRYMGTFQAIRDLAARDSRLDGSIKTGDGEDRLDVRIVENPS
jgi:hypothetical protein